MADANSVLFPHDMPLRDKLAQLIFVRIGSNLPPIRIVEEDEARIAELLKTCPIGGLVLFNGGPGTPQTLQRLQEVSHYPLLVGSDMERGAGQQIRGLTLFPHLMAFEQLGTNAHAIVGQFAESIAAEARAAGVHITFAPVTDVNTNRRNPIIATRAFSESATSAAVLATSFVLAGEAAGLYTTAKHFPGHGDTHQDSHDTLPQVDRSPQQMADCELLPFQAAIEAGCSLVMTAHVAYPQLDPSGLPSTLSPVILKQILRDQLGFRGVCCSDSLLMAGVRERFESEGEMALAALTAGVDLLLDIKDPELVVNYLADCITQGTLTEARVNEAFERIQALKQRSFSKAENKNTLRPTTVAAAVAEDVAQGAIQVIKRPEAGPLPFDPQRPLVAIFLKPFASPLDPPEQPLADALRGKFGDVQYVELGPKADAAAFEEAWKLAVAGDQLLLAMIVKPAAWHAFGLLPAQKEFVQQVSRERQVVLACLGVPYAFDDYPDASVQICTYSDVPVSQRALAEFVRQPFQADTL